MEAGAAGAVVDAGTVFSVAGVLHVLIVVVVGTHVLLNKQNEGAAFSWLGIVTLSPFFGAVMYWVFGINRIRRHAQAELPRGHTPEVPGGGVALPRVAPLDELLGKSADVASIGAVAGSSPEGEAERASPERPSGPPAARRGADLPRDLSWAAALPPRWQGLLRLGLAIHPAPYLDGNRVEPLMNGDEAYPRMLEAIDSAAASVVMSSYIFEYDAAGRRFVDALIRARERGAEVRVLIDGLGVGYGFSPVRADRVLRKAGVPTARFLSFLSRSGTRFLNLRNHRKILSVDGRVAFVGGMNIRAGNVLSEPSRHHTQDVHFRVRGPVIEQINAVFVEDWQFSTGETLALPPWRAAPEATPATAGEGAVGQAAANRTAHATAHATAGPVAGPVARATRRSAAASVAAEAEPAGPRTDEEARGRADEGAGKLGPVVARVLLDGPDDNYQKLQHAMIGAINVARRSIDVVTPYFLPGRTVVSALQIASLRGVRVRICVPSKNNLPFVGWAMRANVGKLVGYGIEIVESPPPFDHSKLFVVDDSWTLIGSSNWDARSLELNFEINLECYDRAFNARVRGIVEAKCDAATPVDGERRDPFPVRLRNNFFRLFSPYL